jgi:hypothetical protein
VRTAITVSALAHAVFCALNAFSAPGPIAKPPEQTVTVDIVSPNEIAEAATPAQPATTNTPAASMASESAPLEPSRLPDQSDKVRRSQQASQAKTALASAAAPPARLPAETTTSAPAAPRPQEEPKNEPKTELPQFGASWLDAALSSLPVTANQYDESASMANLSQNDIAAFKAHLQQCWKPPSGLADDGQLMAVLRVALRPDGMLAEEPTMLAATASSSGPALLQTAMRALRQCQPYGFLPSAKYNEWKVLDLSFSASGLSTRPAPISGFDNR